MRIGAAAGAAITAMSNAEAVLRLAWQPGGGVLERHPWMGLMLQCNIKRKVVDYTAWVTGFNRERSYVGHRLGACPRMD